MAALFFAIDRPAAHDIAVIRRGGKGNARAATDRSGASAVSRSFHGAVFGAPGNAVFHRPEGHCDPRAAAVGNVSVGRFSLAAHSFAVHQPAFHLVALIRLSRQLDAHVAIEPDAVAGDAPQNIVSAHKRTDKGAVFTGGSNDLAAKIGKLNRDIGIRADVFKHELIIGAHGMCGRSVHLDRPFLHAVILVWLGGEGDRGAFVDLIKLIDRKRGHILAARGGTQSAVFTARFISVGIHHGVDDGVLF